MAQKTTTPQQTINYRFMLNCVLACTSAILLAACLYAYQATKAMVANPLIMKSASMTMASSPLGFLLLIVAAAFLLPFLFGNSNYYTPYNSNRYYTNGGYTFYTSSPTTHHHNSGNTHDHMGGGYGGSIVHSHSSSSSNSHGHSHSSGGGGGGSHSHGHK